MPPEEPSSSSPADSSRQPAGGSCDDAGSPAEAGLALSSPSPTAYGRHLGIEVVRAEAGEAELRMGLGDHLTNKRGVAHGGAVASLLDSALGAAVVSSLRPEEWCGTVQLSIQFRDPARHGPLQATARLLRRGRHTAFAEGTVYDARERPVASAHGTWAIWPRHPDSEGTAP